MPQQLRKVDMGEAPMTIALVIEFSNLFQRYWSAAWYQTLQLAWGFAESLKPEDYAAVVAYDIRPEILTDFTTDKRKIREGLDRLKIAAFSEANMFDAVTDTAERMSEIEGRKAILLITSGIDTFSKITYDQTRKKLQESGVPVYSIGLMQMQREMADAYMSGPQRMDFLQADNELRTFAKETGGAAYFPQIPGRVRADLSDAAPGTAQSVRTDVPAEQYQARWRVPQAQGGTGQSGDQRAAARERRKGQADQVSDRHQDRLQSAARGGVGLVHRARARRARSRVCQELNLATLQDDANPLTARLRVCYAPTRSANEDSHLFNTEHSSCR